MSMDAGQKQQFQDRLKRIADGGPNTMAQVYVGPADEPVVRKRGEKASVLPDWKENIRYPLSFVKAFLIGVLAVFLSRYIRFHLSGGSLTGEGADIAMMIDGAVAVAAGFALKMMFRLNSQAYGTAQTVGVIAMIGLMHNFVHIAPKPFALIFSPEWVEEVVTYTEPESFLFRGVSFVFGTPEEGAMPEKPTVLRLGQGK